jgi:nucleoside phosphorylase
LVFGAARARSNCVFACSETFVSLTCPKRFVCAGYMALVDYLVLTPLDEEWRTVRSVLCPIPDNVRSKPIEAMTYYLWNEGIDDPRDGQGEYLIVAASMGRWTQGQAFAAGFSTHSLTHWKPSRLVLVGIAGSLEPDRILLGDVVVSTHIFGYEVGDAEGGDIHFRPTFNQIGALDLDRIRAFLDDPVEYPAWQKECSDAAPAAGVENLSRAPELHLEVTASGEYVVKSIEFGKKLRDEIDEHISAVEMEARGLHQAIYLNSRRTDGLMIRGVSDYADENKSALEKQSKAGYRKFATANAARLLRRLWQRIPVRPLSLGYELDLSVGPHERFRQTEIPNIEFKNAGAQDIAFPQLLNRSCPTPELMLEVRAFSDAEKEASGYRGICIVESPEKRVVRAREKQAGELSFALPASEWGLRAELLLSFPSRVVKVAVTCSDEFHRSVSAPLRFDLAGSLDQFPGEATARTESTLLATLSRPELVKLIKLRMNRAEVASVWHAVLKTRMDDDMGNRPLSDCAIELVERAHNRNKLSLLIEEIGKERPDLINP